MRTLTHITLNSGHSRESPRSEVRSDIIKMMRPLLRRALKGERVPVPSKPGWTINGGVEGSACVVTVWAGVGSDAVPVVSVGVAGGRNGSDTTWRMLHSMSSGSPLVTSPEAMPSIPWCGVALLVGAALVPREELGWLGDFERVIAWTWISLQRK